MTTIGAFQPAVSGMSSQSDALGVISTNIANVTTTGYKRTDTNFQTVLSGSVSFRMGNPESPGAASVQTDLGGVRSADRPRISLAGEYKATGRDLDLAVDGRGFFVMKQSVTDGGASVYGRDGSLSVATVAGANGAGEQGFLVDKNGYFLQGWAAAADGSFPTTGPTTSLRVDPAAFSSIGAPTTAARLVLNLPATDAVGAVETYSIDAFDSKSTQQPFQLAFSKLSANSWSLAANGTSLGTLQFDPSGALQEPKSYDVSTTFANGANSSFTLDLSSMTQYAADFMAFDYTRDGYAAGSLTDFHFDDNGDVMGVFDNGRTRPLYRLALADFVNPDGLSPISGNVLEATEDAGPAVIGVASQNGLGRIDPATLEQSNVDLAGEFSRMIMTQKAYSASASAFRTLDEMTETARDLHR